MDLNQARKIMGQNFIGPQELKKIAFQLNLPDPCLRPSPTIPLNPNQLKKIHQDYILILGMPKDKKNNKLTLNTLHSFFGWDPEKSEPCFYNQDWYLKEKFAKDKTLGFKWYLIKKNVEKKSRGKYPEDISKSFKKQENFPSAILTAYVFFAYYFLTKGKIIWKHDFIWCSDKDNNGDRIYTGRYIDPNGINKNGFNIHRHLSIRPCYGLVSQIKL